MAELKFSVRNVEAILRGTGKWEFAVRQISFPLPELMRLGKNQGRFKKWQNSANIRQTT